MYRFNRIIGLSLIFIFNITILFTSLIIANTLDSVQNEAPKLITDPFNRTTPELLKRGLWGVTTATVWIDTTGLVDSCTVTASKNRAFDSLIKSKVTAAHFTPAIDNGHVVNAIVNIEISVPQDSLVVQSLRLAPNFYGSVIDTAKRPLLPKTRIYVYYTDTTEDSAITIGFNRYLSLISNRTDQKYDGKLLIAETDSNGRFAFKLLPRGRFLMSMQAAGYDVGHFRGHIISDEPQECQYILKPSEDYSHLNINLITVYGRRRHLFAEKKMVITNEENHIGFSPLLSNVVQAKPEIRRVPEGPSMMLVRSGCPYDNVFMVAGVPMLAPFHFGGHPYADKDGLMISALSTIKVIINDIAAKKVDASGCIVVADPEKIKYDNDSAAKGFYLKGDYGSIGVDLLAAYSVKKKTEDFVQVGYSVSDNYLLKFDYKFYSSVSKGNQGIGIPISYGNFTLGGSKSLGTIRCTAFGWLAWDSYYSPKAITTKMQQICDSLVYFGLAEKALFPWGMGAVKFSIDSSNRSLSIGGAHQFFGTGKQIDTNVFSTRSFLNNGEVTIDFDTVIRAPFVAKLVAHISHDEWNGFLLQQGNDLIDTLYRTHGTETGVHLNTSLIKQTGRITSVFDLLASGINYTNNIQITGDAGASVTYDGHDYHVGIHFGRITSRPDVRGLPDSLFRRHLNRTYITSLPLFFRYSVVTKFGIEPYVRYCTNAPQQVPIKNVWDPNKSTPVIARGVDLCCHIEPTSRAEFSVALNLADAQRKSITNNSLAYEWSLPWTIRTNLHLHSKNDRFHIYIDYLRSKGLPYYNVDNGSYAALPVYRSLDLNFQIRTFMKPQPHINKLDGYITLKNIQDMLKLSNVRDYYWDSKGHKKPIYLGSGIAAIGARFGIKF